MSETAKQREERLARAASGRGRDREAGEGKPAKRPTAQRTTPVRLTVDLTPQLHRRLKNWTGFAATELDVAAVPAADVVRIMVDLLTNVGHPNSDLRDQLVAAVLEDLRARQ